MAAGSTGVAPRKGGNTPEIVKGGMGKCEKPGHWRSSAETLSVYQRLGVSARGRVGHSPGAALYDLTMAHTPTNPSSGNVFAVLGIREPDVELAKADLAARIQRLAQHRRLTPTEAALLLEVPQSDLQDLFQGRLATCSLDQLLRMLTRLGDDVEIMVRPRLQRTRRGALRVLQAAAVERPENFEAVHLGRGKPPSVTRRDSLDQRAKSGIDATPIATRDERQLLDKHAVEKMTSLDITTIYRRMAAGTFPQPVRVGRRRVAWRTSDIMQWQQGLEVGTETLRWKTHPSHEENPAGSRRRRRPR